ncbi:hypothetical protein ACFSNO_22840 [Streptomyces cirratus]
MGQGYASGLAGLATDFGITVDEPTTPSSPPERQPAPAPATVSPAPEPVRLSKITLTKAAPAVR